MSVFFMVKYSSTKLDETIDLLKIGIHHDVKSKKLIKSLNLISDVMFFLKGIDEDLIEGKRTINESKYLGLNITDQLVVARSTDSILDNIYFKVSPSQVDDIYKKVNKDILRLENLEQDIQKEYYCLYKTTNVEPWKDNPFDSLEMYATNFGVGTLFLKQDHNLYLQMFNIKHNNQTDQFELTFGTKEHYYSYDSKKLTLNKFSPYLNIITVEPKEFFLDDETLLQIGAKKYLHSFVNSIKNDYKIDSQK